MSDGTKPDSTAGEPPLRALPPAVTAGRRTPDFTSDTVPPALLAAHVTSAWAQLVVSVGAVRFVEEDPPWEVVAVPGEPVTIVPGRRHHIEPAEGAVFAVQFYDSPPCPDSDGAGGAQ